MKRICPVFDTMGRLPLARPMPRRFTSLYEHKRYRTVGRPRRLRDLSPLGAFTVNGREVHVHMGGGRVRADTDVFPCLCGLLYNVSQMCQPVERITRRKKRLSS